MFPLLEIQKMYGRKLDPDLLMTAWEAVLSKHYSVEQIIYALEKYALKHDDFPSPANINNILNPEPPPVTQAEFIAAQKTYEREGFNKFSDAKFLIDRYEAEKTKLRADHTIQSREVAAIGRDTFKRIE
tara:strand:- start:901 stop:1287 length:387 start_codon:yes stop_codon:yes gene_type:complete